MSRNTVAFLRSDREPLVASVGCHDDLEVARGHIGFCKAIEQWESGRLRAQPCATSGASHPSRWHHRVSGLAREGVGFAASRDVAPAGMITTFLTLRRTPLCVTAASVSSRARTSAGTSEGAKGLWLSRVPRQIHRPADWSLQQQAEVGTEPATRLDKEGLESLLPCGGKGRFQLRVSQLRRRR